MSTKTMTINAKHRLALARIVEVFGAGRFRRSDLSAQVYPLTSPRSRELADAISERVLREAAAAGKIRREGHLHWIKVGEGRVLLDGSAVPELPDAQELTLKTKCPQKFLSVDMETGDVWRGTAQTGWKRQNNVDRAVLAALLGSRAAQ